MGQVSIHPEPMAVAEPAGARASRLVKWAQQQIAGIARDEAEEGGVPPSEMAQGACLSFIHELEVAMPILDSLPVPYIGPISNGAIYGEWRAGDRHLVLVASARGHIRLSRALADNGKFAVSETVHNPDANQIAQASSWLTGNH